VHIRKADEKAMAYESTEVPHKLPKIPGPGDCVSVDQFESSILGLVGQIKVKLTKSRYRVDTVFVELTVIGIM
jgi:hypothetical protein